MLVTALSCSGGPPYLFSFDGVLANIKSLFVGMHMAEQGSDYRRAVEDLCYFTWQSLDFESVDGVANRRCGTCITFVTKIEPK